MTDSPRRDGTRPAHHGHAPVSLENSLLAAPSSSWPYRDNYLLSRDRVSDVTPYTLDAVCLHVVRADLPARSLLASSDLQPTRD